MSSLDLQGIEYTNDNALELENEAINNPVKYLSSNLEKLKDITLTDDEATKITNYAIPKNEKGFLVKLAMV